MIKKRNVATVVLSKDGHEFRFWGLFSSRDKVKEMVPSQIDMAAIHLADTTDCMDESDLADFDDWEAIITLCDEEEVKVVKNEDEEEVEIIVDRYNGDFICSIEERVWGYCITSEVD